LAGAFGALALAGLAHDLGHVLGELGHRARRARAAAGAAQGAEALRAELAALEAGLARAEGLRRGLGALAQGEPLQLTRIDVGEQLSAAAAWLRQRAGPGQEVIDQGPAEGALRIWAEAEAVQRVLINLGQNALQAGARTLRLGCAPGSHPRRLRLLVADDGPGLPPALTHRPFAARPDGQGRGLGLSVARELAQRLEGSLSLLESGPQGTTFALQLERLP
jgi:C4-dicarboxylate-specific signal transduction histidine kinase